MGLLRIAIRNRPRIAEARARVAQANARLRRVRAAYWPVLSLDTGYLRANAPSMVLGKTLDQLALDLASADLNDPDELDNFENGTTVRLGLFDPGRKRRALSAKHGLSAERFSRQAIENNLVDAVVKAYYAVLEADEAIKVAKGSLDTVASQLRETRARARQGAALETDVLSLEVREATAKEALIRARNARKLALSALANVMGLAPDTHLELSGAEWKPRNIPTKYEDGLDVAIQLRPELQGIREHIRASEQTRDAARRSRLPRLDFMARGYVDTDDLGYDMNDGNWLVGLTVSVDVFDGFYRSSLRAEADARVQRLTASQQKLLLGIQLEVKQAYLVLEEAAERVKVASAAVNQARKALSLVKKQFESGAATVTRYLEAEQDLTAARSRLIAAKYDYKKALAEVGRAIGFCGTCAREAILKESGR